MFVEALEITQHFTHPVLMAYKNVNDDIKSAVGAFVVVNKDGWIVTAGHNLTPYVRWLAEVEDTRSRINEINAVRFDNSLTAHERAKKLQGLPTVKGDSKAVLGAFWGWPNVVIRDITTADQLVPTGFENIIDLAVGRLEPFNPDWVKRYPVFKRSDGDFKAGTSLCKQGFPFNEFAPIFDEETGKLNLPEDLFPMSGFPTEGILTRVRQYELTDVDATGAAVKCDIGFPVQYIETSSPGLRGQSGGPTVDRHGTVWAIQVRTEFLSLGFEPKVPEKKRRFQNQSKNEKPPTVHQFQSVGLGVHPETISFFFKARGIKFELAEY